jgi:hypothetical protein
MGGTSLPANRNADTPFLYPTRITVTRHDFFRNMGRGGRFGKYGEIKRFERLRQKRRNVLPQKPLKQTPPKKSLKA